MADFARIRGIFDAVIDAPEGERAELVHQQCGGDLTLEADILSLLAAESRGQGWFEQFLGGLVEAALGDGAAHPSDEAPRRMRRYEIIERIASGSMGVVYRARDLQLDRAVALKFLPAGMPAAHRLHSRLFAEARAASALDHANIGVVYELGEAEDGRPFIAMAWYDGETLRERIRRGPLPIDDAIAIARQIGAALSAAHRARVIHRDVKPANVILTPAGVVKLLDFGIATRTGADSDPLLGAGTPAYMSPEQVRGSAVDSRSDLWSFGVVLYEMLAGRKPFGNDRERTLDDIRASDPPPLQLVRPELPPDLVAIVSRCLAKDPDARFQTADDIVRALDQLGHGPTAADGEAHYLYLKGRSAWRERTRSGFHDAVAYLEGAIERAPRFAQAHAALAAVYVNLSNFEFMPSGTALARAEASAERALTLDPALGEARAAYGFVLASRGRYDDAEAELLRAIELDPRSPWAHHYYALLLLMLGRTAEAGEQLRAALALDALSLPAQTTLGIVHFMLGRAREARDQLLAALALAPGFVIALHFHGALSASLGDVVAAAAMLERALTQSPGFPGVRAALAHTYRQLGRDDEADRLERELEDAVTDERSRTNLALGHAIAGRTDQAFEMLQQAHWDVPTLIELRADPLLAGFRRDERYASLLALHGLR